MRRAKPAGLIAATELYGDPGAVTVDPDAVPVLALAEPGEEIWVYWIGDCRVWGFDGERLRQYTKDHSMGEFLRRNGDPPTEAALHDNWVRTSLGQATGSAQSDGPRSHFSDGLWRATTVSPPGQKTCPSRRACSGRSSTRPLRSVGEPTSTGEGMFLPRPLASSARPTARGLKASVPTP